MLQASHFLLLFEGFAFAASHVYGVIRIALQFHFFALLLLPLHHFRCKKEKVQWLYALCKPVSELAYTRCYTYVNQRDALEINEK